MTLRGGGGLGVLGRDAKQPSIFFSQEEGWPLPEKIWKKTTGAAKKPCTQSIMQKYLQQRETVGEAAADEEEEEEQEEEQQEDTEDSGGESGDDKCMVCGEKEEDDVDIEDWVACEMCSQWIHSKCIPSNHPYSISHADFHCHICLQ